MATKVYLIRHGETEGAEARRYKGHIDVPLSRNGIEQMKRLAQFLSSEELKNESTEETSDLPRFRSYAPRAVYCSDLSRVKKSAEIISRPFGLQPVEIPELKERNFGIWEGMTFDEIQSTYPEEFRAWADNPVKFSPMQGESTLAVRERGLRAFNTILEKHENETVAIVAHGGINRIVLCEALGMPLENIFRIEQDF
jgi:alpha-ribazole phosphatase/probable phosphoglycerate mutase